MYVSLTKLAFSVPVSCLLNCDIDHNFSPFLSPPPLSLSLSLSHSLSLSLSMSGWVVYLLRRLTLQRLDSLWLRQTHGHWKNSSLMCWLISRYSTVTLHVLDYMCGLESVRKYSNIILILSNTICTAGACKCRILECHFHVPSFLKYHGI